MKERPHIAVLSVQLEVHVANDKGECSGQTINTKTLKEYGIDNAFLVSFGGKNMDECLTKLKQKIEALKNE